VIQTVGDWGEEDGYFSSEEEKCGFQDELTYLLIHQRASFNSPVWFNVGVEERPQCSACFILAVEDSLESLLALQQTEARLFKYGSGAGTNLSSIRSTYERLDGGGTPSGPVAFMKGYDAWAGIVKSGGKTRRAAKMQILNVDHPDILDFIQSKFLEEKKAQALIAHGFDEKFSAAGGAYDTVAFQNANLSVRVTDDFMNAALNGDSYWTREVMSKELCRELSAREVLHHIAEATHFCGDPGLQFDDAINRWHTCPEAGRINASNPCSEYMHLDNSACNLASINLLPYLREDGSFAISEFLHTISIFLTAQDILIDRSAYPTSDVKKCARRYRQLGLGYSNLGATLMSLGIAYDSEEARHWAASITALLSAQSYLLSTYLAERKGAFSGFPGSRESMLGVIARHQKATQNLPDSEVRSTALSLWEQALARGKQIGFRNSQVTVLAPTGTISFMMDCDTTGIEPDLALQKHKLLADGTTLTIVNRSVLRALTVLGYSKEHSEAVLEHLDRTGTVEDAPHLRTEHLPVFDCALRPASGARMIAVEGHLLMMAAVQPFLSGAISKTVNLPAETTVEDIVEIYINAWKLGLKAVALYRNGSKIAQPLSVKGAPRESDPPDYTSCGSKGWCS
jgi:ribonucleoside-diphosphate reductase alpha chain